MGGLSTRTLTAILGACTVLAVISAVVPAGLLLHRGAVAGGAGRR
ncbi:hypothetical protein PYK79_15735 [Streptomyces sp. ID05-04B]|nr:hypothetical protein [Streptomyces sp. P3]MDX5564502.1 hypothetical protein [Streptomyces sp. ID05-04B]